MKTVDLDTYFDRAADLAIARSRELGRPLPRRDRIGEYVGDREKVDIVAERKAAAEVLR